MDTLANTVGIIGAGPAGLVTAHVLLQDGFDVQILTEDRSPGGVWARHRVYPSMKINKCVSHAPSFTCPSFAKKLSAIAPMESFASLLCPCHRLRTLLAGEYPEKICVIIWKHLRKHF